MEAKKHYNRYNNCYWFEEIEPNKYEIKGDLDHWRFGGKKDTPGVDLEDLGFADPSGGPFISLGAKYLDREIININGADNKVVITLKEEK